MLSARDHFLYNPSLIWLPFGKRTAKDITFKVGPTFETAGVEFVVDAAGLIDPVAHTVRTASGAVHGYDYLVIATGTRNNLDAVDGLAENSNTITTLETAIRTGEAWKAFRDRPGEVVVAATQGASCFGAAYEFLFNTSYQLKKAGLKKQVKLTYVTSEPFLGHFGIGGLPHGETLLGMFLKKEKIEHRTKRVHGRRRRGCDPHLHGRQDPLRLLDDHPALRRPGLPARDARPGERGRLRRGPRHLPDQDLGRHLRSRANGSCHGSLDHPDTGGVPKTGFPTERMAHIAAKNIAAQIKGETPVEAESFADIPAVCIMDAGNNGSSSSPTRCSRRASTACSSPAPEPCLQGGFREVLHLEDEGRARHASVSLPAQPISVPSRIVMITNEGTVDRGIRALAGIALAAVAFAVGVGSVLGVVLVVLAVVLVGTAATGFCSLYRILGISADPRPTASRGTGR